MELFRNLRLRFRPPRIEDQDFGRLLYMYVPATPANSYWEGEWRFGPTGTRVSIALPGTPDGPDAQARAFYLSLPARFNDVIARVRPGIDSVFRQWLGRPLKEDLWQDVTLAGFGVENPGRTPLAWDVAFETTGEK